MADRSINELVEAKSVTSTDLFILQQGATAKKLPGQTLENWLLSLADGHGGIQSIAKISTSGLVDTYRITLADTTTFDFEVTNGRGIKSIAYSSTQDLKDIYVITYTDGTQSAFDVTNGAKGDKGDNTYTWIKYASKDPAEPPHSMGDIPDRWLGIYWGAKSSAPTLWSEYKWYEIKGEKGSIGDPATVVSTVTEYQTSTSGTVIPSGNWVKNPPAVPQGRFLWTRTTAKFNSGSPIVSYGVSYTGRDGKGQVDSVNGQSGIVDLKAENVGAIPNTAAPEEVPPENTLDIIKNAGRLLAKGGDAIVASGKSGTWDYVKYESGLGICYKQYSLYTAINKPWGTAYLGEEYIKAEPFPFTFAAAPIMFASVHGNQACYAIIEGNPTTNQTPIITAARPAESAKQTVYYNVLYIGRWK